ncbi:hypothetical protein vBKpnAMK4_00508 [Klebsiella phage vB_Kpn_AM_K4]
MPIPRLFHKAEIKRALKYDEEYNWDEARCSYSNRVDWRCKQLCAQIFK